MRIVNRIVLTACLAAACASCGDVVREGKAPVFLVVDQLEGAQGNKNTTFFSNLVSDVITNLTTPAPCSADNPCPTIFNDLGRVTLRLTPKDIGAPGAPTTPTTNNEVTISRIRVSYRRTDGRNVQGVDIPYAFETASTGTVPATGTAQISFTLVRNDAKSEAPLVQLRTNGVIIDAIADVTVIGQDRVGNDISATASIGVAFGNFGD
jgi:hypothetical protein